MAHLMNPLLYIAMAIVIWQCYRLRSHHRRFWGVGLLSPLTLSVQHIFAGVIAGAVWSAAFYFGGWDFALTPVLLWWLWGAVFLLGLVRMRWMGVAYAAGLVSVLVLISDLLEPGRFGSVTRAIILSLREVDVAQLLLFSGVLTVTSGVLTIWQGRKAYCPLLLPWRGKSMGAIFLQSFWAIPILVHSPEGWFVFPMMLVYTDLARSRSSQERARLSGLLVVGFGIILSIFGWMGHYIGGLRWAGALWSLFGCELVHLWAYWWERQQAPLFQTHDDGIRVLAVQQGSPAADMGIVPGEIVTAVNGQSVHSMTELYAALQRSPAFCKLELVNENGQQRYVQRSRYEGESHQLGIVPVEAVAPSAERNPHRSGWWPYFIGRTSYVRNMKKEWLNIEG